MGGMSGRAANAPDYSPNTMVVQLDLCTVQPSRHVRASLLPSLREHAAMRSVPFRRNC